MEVLFRESHSLKAPSYQRFANCILWMKYIMDLLLLHTCRDFLMNAPEASIIDRFFQHLGLSWVVMRL